ncbi:MAG: 50S ribosomal protein L5 [Candidatus Nitrosocaldus sp.]|nr:50S ribosomal protein L5 [Candidatus Nitrosocaldus sp.]MCS7141100.1 50S ribosomal protein L5 [Candidatus Nitrosocaldus sp.]MDW8000064.1 50S ribosomal protein L5 [Candidatus Nitrosocaldus sp.]MDW8275522.1 50S ribosomal protein L5 [Candidatus Nitrosocaldus sp.]
MSLALEKKENLMRSIRIGKVVINAAVGKSGEPIEKAKRILEEITGQRPAVRVAKKTIRDFGIHKGEPIAVIVTLRKEKALNVLKRLLAAKGNRVKQASFDDHGNVSFGIREHIDIPGIKYRPELGIIGMDVCIALERPGYRVARRKVMPCRIGKGQRVTKQEAVEFLRSLGVEVV